MEIEPGQKPFECLSIDDQTIISCDTIITDRAFTLHQVLGENDCVDLIRRLEEMGVEKSSRNTEYRSNERCRIWSESLSGEIYRRICGYLKPIVITPEDSKNVGDGFRLEGIWIPHSITPAWVFSRYLPGTHFGPHYDTPTVLNFSERSLQTLIIYLNDDFEGGHTNFLDDQKQPAESYDNSQYFTGDPANIICQQYAKTGSAIIFNHHILHEGEMVQRGNKFILRADIIYKRYDFPEDIGSKEREAVDWMIKAGQWEFKKDYQQAMICYKKAFRLWPELEFVRSEI